MNVRAIVRRARERARYLLTSIVDAVAPQSLPSRSAPLHLTFVFHTEAVAEERSFRALLEFARHFECSTGEQITLCVTTPLCPQTEFDIERQEITEQEYAARLGELAECAEIGYHGHFFVRAEECGDEPYAGLPDRAMNVIRSAPWFGKLVPMVGDRFNPDRVRAQISSEVQWLADAVGAPRAYVAGWWFMTSEIVSALEENGIAVDCSIRQRHKPTLTDEYLPPDTVPPRGLPFILPPSRRIIEIQSCFYPIEHPRNTIRYLMPTLEHEGDRPLFLVFPSHETELLAYGDVFRALIEVVKKRAPSLRWCSLGKQVDLARKNWML